MTARLAFLLLLALPGRGLAGLAILPGDLKLEGPQARQRLLVVEKAGEQVVADRTGKATFSSSHPSIVSVDASGNVRAAGDGEAVITARHGKESATVKVSVRGTKADFTWGFRNHVQAVLTRSGCNSGACHGALAGKGGLKLSLRGYDPTADHFV